MRVFLQHVAQFSQYHRCRAVTRIRQVHNRAASDVFAQPSLFLGWREKQLKQYQKSEVIAAVWLEPLDANGTQGILVRRRRVEVEAQTNAHLLNPGFHSLLLDSFRILIRFRSFQ